MIRLYAMCNLIFLFVTFHLSCERGAADEKITLQWNNKKATGISIPKKLIKNIPIKSIPSLLSIRLENGSKSVSILGDLTEQQDNFLFEPLIPFTPGLSYKIVAENLPIAFFKIPDADPAEAPSLIGIFPSADTLPENLLKIYLHFSQPMREGKSGEFVTLIKNKTDTVRGAFLDLKPELWNADRTVLTLWLDPGRIKRDLQPNIKMGAPLQRGEIYHILVSKKWQDEQGLPLNKTFTKSFLTSERDSVSPNPDRWNLHIPEKATTKPLIIEFGETLDYSLLNESLSLINAEQEPVHGHWVIFKRQEKCQFVPDSNWHPGKYTLRIQTRLEDLAGNNLNRLFESDIKTNKKVNSTSAFSDITLMVRP